MACQKVCKQGRDDTSVDVRHLGVSLSEKQTADLLLCHGTQPAGFVTVDCLSRMHAKSSPQINVSHMPAISPARAANMTTHAWTKLYTEIMS